MEEKLTEETPYSCYIVFTKTSFMSSLNSTLASTTDFQDKSYTKNGYTKPITLLLLLSQSCGSPCGTSNAKKIDQMLNNKKLIKLLLITTKKETKISS